MFFSYIPVLQLSLQQFLYHKVVHFAVSEISLLKVTLFQLHDLQMNKMRSWSSVFLNLSRGT